MKQIYKGNKLIKKKRETEKTSWRKLDHEKVLRTLKSKIWETVYLKLGMAGKDRSLWKDIVHDVDINEF